MFPFSYHWVNSAGIGRRVSQVVTEQIPFKNVLNNQMEEQD